MAENKWTREETIIAFNVYCKIPFKDSSKTHPLIVKHAKIIGRSPSALNMKIGNIGRLDPDLKSKNISGLAHGAKLEQEIWNEFVNHPDELAYESEKIIAKLSNSSIEKTAGIHISDLPQGLEREYMVKQRVNQAFFREAVLSAYNYRCCISGVQSPSLLEACHIISWADDEKNRTNPKNGLCMNPFFHKAYDSYLISINPENHNIVISEKLIQETAEGPFKYFLQKLNDQQMAMPSRFTPDILLLEKQYEQYKSSI